MMFTIARILFMGVCLLPNAFAGPQDLRLATSADTFPYNFGAAEGCRDVRGVCGFEIELFDAICAEAALNCQWTVRPWGDVDAPGSVLFQLVNPSNGSFAYDAVVASASTTAKRRAVLQFSAVYYTAWNIFVGKKELNLAFDAAGYPLDTQALKIGTWEGSMLEQLQRVYPAPKNIHLVSLADPVAALKRGDIDLVFTFTGTETELVRDGTYLVKGKLIESDQQDVVGAAFRKDAASTAWKDKVNAGLISVRKKGIYQRLSQKWMGRDIWDCKSGPKFVGDGCP